MARQLACPLYEYGKAKSRNVRVATAHGILKARTSPEYAHSADRLGLSDTAVRGARGANDVHLLGW